MWIIWEIGAMMLFKRDMAEKDVCRAHTFRSMDYKFFCTYFSHRSLMSSEGKKRIIKASARILNSFYYFFFFWFQGLSFKTQFEIEFRPTINAGQLVLK